jgi:hypothetical protein
MLQVALNAEDEFACSKSCSHHYSSIQNGFCYLYLYINGLWTGCHNNEDVVVVTR